eukprot:scaffold9103_cov267-Chaetoceros_neogracile.AAC.8
MDPKYRSIGFPGRHCDWILSKETRRQTYWQSTSVRAQCHVTWQASCFWLSKKRSRGKHYCTGIDNRHVGCPGTCNICRDGRMLEFGWTGHSCDIEQEIEQIVSRTMTATAQTE